MDPRENCWLEHAIVVVHAVHTFSGEVSHTPKRLISEVCIWNGIIGTSKALIYVVISTLAA